jgi:hypothetical protein
MYSLRYLNVILDVLQPMITNEAVETELLHYKLHPMWKIFRNQDSSIKLSNGLDDGG